ncbi:MAG: hypothetical protein OEV42_16790 [Deltaproteobacteria bacterium]|nr:hypothetical protein [Deltaproteobacteria bacterium]
MIRAFTLLIVLIILSVSQIGEAKKVEEKNDNIYLSFYKKTVSELLPEYRLHDEEDYQSYWKHKNSYVYKTKDDEGNYKAPYWTKGFFNEDETIDFAYILINKQNNKKYLFAIVSEGEKYKAIQLGEGNNLEMGIATQQKGKILTASGKGYWEPTKDDPPEVFVKRNAVSYFMFESAASLFIWNEKDRNFKRHWISD